MRPYDEKNIAYYAEYPLSLTALVSRVRACTGIMTPKDYYEEAKERPHWPLDPATYYGPFWRGWAFLFPRPINERRTFIPYASLLSFMRQRDITTMVMYEIISLANEEMPMNPRVAYPDEWQGWDALFNLAKALSIPCGFEEYVRDLFLPAREEWTPKKLMNYNWEENNE